MKLIIDSFAGGGGASTGIEMALRRSPDVAINHSADALAMHQVNHPDTLHLDSNIWDVSPTEVTGGRPVGLFWASPDCKHFSKAKGGKPMDRNIRDLAWVVVRWAEQVRPDVIILENVEEFVTWGPLYEDGKPIAELRGHTFETWVGRLRKAGYKVQWRELRACDYGAPTIRKRFFLIARRDRLPIVWPKPTHGDPKKPEAAKAIRAGKLKPWRTAAEIIDWSLPCPSIFDTSDEIMGRYGLRAVRPLAAATMRRIARGVVRYVLEAANPFVVKFQTGSTGHAIVEPLATVTANSFVKRPGGAAPLGVVVPSFVAPVAFAPTCSNGHLTEGVSAGPAIVADNSSLAGLNMVISKDHRDNHGRKKNSAGEQEAVHRDNLTPSIAPPQLASCVVTAAQHGGSVRPADAPVHTIAASTKDQNAIIVPSFVGCGGREGQSAPRGGDEPLGTLTAKADGCVVAPILQTLNHGGGADHAPKSVEDPFRTVTAARDAHALVAPYLVPRYQEREGQSPRVRSVEEPSATVVPGGNEGVLAAVHMSRFTQNGVGSSIDDPVDTVMAGAPKFGVVAAFLAQHNSGNDGHEAEKPVSTLTAGGQGGVSQQAVVAAHLQNMRGSDRRDAAADGPVPTLSAQGTHAALISGFLTKYYGTGDGAAVDGLLHTDTVKDRFGLVTVDIDGETYAIADIGMRMLTPRERFRAQGFPDSYIIDRRPDGSALSSTVQGSCCGNSVCPPLAEALVAANCGHLSARREAAE